MVMVVLPVLASVKLRPFFVLESKGVFATKAPDLLLIIFKTPGSASPSLQKSVTSQITKEHNNVSS